MKKGILNSSGKSSCKKDLNDDKNGYAKTVLKRANLRKYVLITWTIIISDESAGDVECKNSQT
jgi:hypothetical protein